MISEEEEACYYLKRAQFPCHSPLSFPYLTQTARWLQQGSTKLFFKKKIGQLMTWPINHSVRSFSGNWLPVDKLTMTWLVSGISFFCCRVGRHLFCRGTPQSFHKGSLNSIHASKSCLEHSGLLS